jgi:hypothetical protein
MGKQVRYKHRVSWIENGKLETKWFSDHKRAFELYEDQAMRGQPVYYARKITDVFSAYMFDRVKSDNDFGRNLVKLSEQNTGSREE